MSIKMFAAKIPDEVRSEMLKNDLIGNAVVSQGDPNMNLLLDIWHDYIEPHKEKTYCVFCMQNIRKNFIAMEEELIELENQYRKLSSL